MAEATETVTTKKPTGLAVDLGEFIREVQPYSDEKIKLIQKYYKNLGAPRARGNLVPGRTADKDRIYATNAAGNLEIRTTTGAVEETIILKTYVPHDTLARDTMDQERLDALGAANTLYEAALTNLRKAMHTYRTTGAVQPVLAAQNMAKDADRILTRVRYATRGIQALPNPEVREVLFDSVDDKYEVRRLFKFDDPYSKELYRVAVIEHPFNKFYGTYVESPDAVPGQDVDAPVEESVDATLRQKLRDGRWARIFREVDGTSGTLSPYWPADFTMDSVRYSSAYQAFEYQRASEAGLEDLKKRILGTRSARTIQFYTKKMDKQPKDVKGLWLRIFTAVYQQHPELKQKLMETGTDALVFADVRPGPSGTGVGERTKECLDPSKWTGENAVGLSLETLRYQFREGSAAEVAEDTAPTTSVITEEEQEKAKTGAIIGQRKKFFPKR